MADTAQTQDTLQDGEIVAETAASSDATVLLSLEEMIKNNIAAIDKLTAQLREKRNMFSDMFQNDPTYKEHEEKAKEGKIVLQQTKQQILKQPAVMQMAQNIKSLSADLKEKKNANSDYLLEYQRLTNATTIEDLEGNVREIQNNAKAVIRAGKK